MIGPSLSVVHTGPSWRRKRALFDGSCCFGGEESAAETEQAYALKLTVAGLNAVGADARGQSETVGAAVNGASWAIWCATNIRAVLP